MRETLGVKLRWLRLSQNLTQIELADKIGIGKNSISRYENGERIPKMDVLKKYSDYFKVQL